MLTATLYCGQLTLERVDTSGQPFAALSVHTSAHACVRVYMNFKRETYNHFVTSPHQAKRTAMLHVCRKKCEEKLNAVNS
jgi:hypothetical protein